ncbi:hypothetical protein WICMUC_002232 [Wickerhamomyces mucosus]|uniref:Uncharacterized protein n=1 Tax=Wickerhamomyces mucosus TaxID=1378264 RepID=A0A9P8TF00_9ASCO|nr:hypothetical protein WICMUC_002232 [Wickerhamomyces mucosus]
MTVVIVTGASRGIGKAITDILLNDPSTKVLAVARNEDPLTNLKIKYGEDRVATLAGDVSQENTVKEIIELAISRFGSIDAIVANAGVLNPVDKVENANLTEWKELFNINFFSIVSLVANALPHLRNSKGRVVLVSSGASTKGYVTSKAALNHYAIQLSSEEKDISVISVAPGVVDTQMQIDIREKFGKNMTPEALKRFTDLKSNHELLDPIVPATIYANLASKGFDKELNGKYLRYNDPLLESYSV